MDRKALIGFVVGGLVAISAAPASAKAFICKTVTGGSFTMSIDDQRLKTPNGYFMNGQDLIDAECYEALRKCAGLRDTPQFVHNLKCPSRIDRRDISD